MGSAVLAGLLAALAVGCWPGGPARSRRSRPRSPYGTVTQLATALDLVALALTSGAPLVTSLDAVAAVSPPVVRGNLAQVVAALRWGVDERAAWQGLPGAWSSAARALELAARTGTPPGGLLRRAAADLRRAERARIEEASERLGVRIVLPLGLCFLPAFALLTVVPAVAALAGPLLAGGG